ncbi:MAG: hypothetical protein OXS35_00510, partial [Dehalococcoidia bacterium]|nr:hypothetical protein [Dehalococcoidia bacterium]
MKLKALPKLVATGLATSLVLTIVAVLVAAACSDKEPTTEETTVSDAVATETAPQARDAIPSPIPLPEGIIETDREALVALYNATEGPDWNNNTNWLSDVPIGDWDGVDTDASGRVVELNLHDNQLSGEMPPELGNLSSLEVLLLSGNQLSGIPPELGNLPNLRWLHLFHNRLSGEIPPE